MNTFEKVVCFMGTVLMVGILFALFACSPNKVSFDTAEDARKQVRENVTSLAQEYRASQALTDYTLNVRGDSTISLECPQGDGWASIDLENRNANPKIVIKLKCSTVSAGIGCMTDEDFKGKTYAKEEGRCNTDIPFPLPKIGK